MLNTLAVLPLCLFFVASGNPESFHAWNHIFLKTLVHWFMVQKLMHILSFLLKTAVFPLAVFSMLVLLSGSAYAQEMNYPFCNGFSLPKTVSLCNEPIPLENRHVWEMLDRQFTLTLWNPAQVILYLKRAGRYFPFIERALAEGSMPADLKYLAVAESGLLPTIRSRKGAVGTWQFMAKTARLNGLRVDRTVDERRSLQCSTEAAIKYLRTLKDMFGTWALSLAAYNCGGKILKKEMQRQRVKDYYRLNLPPETERFIFRIAAIKIIMENPERYGYNIDREHIYRPINYDTVPVTLHTSLPLIDIAQALDMDFKVIKEINPHILGYHLPKGRYTINVPSRFGLRMAAILSQNSCKASLGKRLGSDGYLIVRTGDTLIGISERTGVSLSTLKEMNDIQGSLIKVGQKLKIVP